MSGKTHATLGGIDFPITEDDRPAWKGLAPIPDDKVPDWLTDAQAKLWRRFVVLPRGLGRPNVTTYLDDLRDLAEERRRYSIAVAVLVHEGVRAPCCGSQETLDRGVPGAPDWCDAVKHEPGCVHFSLKATREQP